MKIFAIILVSFLVSYASGVEVFVGGQPGIVDLDVAITEDAALTCSATFSNNDDRTSPSLEWTYSTVADSEGDHIFYEGNLAPGTDSRISYDAPYSLRISGTVKGDTGYYKCRVVKIRDNPSADSATYRLTVTIPPSAPTCGFPSDLAITIGQGAEFQCFSNEGVPAPEYTWYKDGNPLPSSSSSNNLYANSSFSYSSTTGTLSFSSVSASDAGTYYCMASNKVGSAQCAPTQITTKQVNVGAIVGIVFAVIFAVLLIGVLVWWTWKRGYCDGWFEGKDRDDDEVSGDEGGNDIVLDGAGPLVTKEPSEWSNGTKTGTHPREPLVDEHSIPSTRSSARRMPEGAIRVMP